MSNENKLIEKAGIATAVVAGAATGGVGGALAAVAPVAMTTAANLFANTFTSSSKEKYNNWSDEVYSIIEGKVSKDANQYISENIDDHDFKTVISASTKKILESDDESALHPMAKITAEYLAERKTLDSFFKRSTSLMNELTSDNKLYFEKFLRFFKTQSPTTDCLNIFTSIEGSGKSKINLIHDTETWSLNMDTVGADEVLLLLIQHRFATYLNTVGSASYGLGVAEINKLAEYFE